MEILRETSAPRPTNAYGRSKLAAEDAVRGSRVPFTILRPVLIYGRGVRGNLARLLQLAHSPWPLPLALCHNRRSLLARENLIAAIHWVLSTPASLGETYCISDPGSLTLAEIVRALRQGAGYSPRLLPVPPLLLAATFKAIGCTDEWERLGGSLVAEPDKLLSAGWQPPINTRAGLIALASGRSPEVRSPTM